MKKTKKKRNIFKINVIICTILLLFGCVFYGGYRLLYKNRVMKGLYPLKYQMYVDKYSKEYNLQKSLVYGIIKTESDFDEKAVSSAGAKGLMQITPDTFDWALFKDKNKEYTLDHIFEPEVNIKYGCYIFRLFLDEFEVEETAIAAYNAGRGAVNKWLKDDKYSKDGKTLDYIPYNETRYYVKKVTDNKNKYKEIYSFDN